MSRPKPSDAEIARLTKSYYDHPERFPNGRPSLVPPVARDPETIRQSMWRTGRGPDHPGDAGLARIEELVSLSLSRERPPAEEAELESLVRRAEGRKLTDEEYAENVATMLRQNARAFIEAGLEPPAYRVSWPRPDSTR